MASFGCSSGSVRPRFFANLLPPDLHKLKVPSEFMKYLTGRNSSNVANIFCPLSKLWHIELYQDGSETFFRNGWPQFSKFHDLGEGFTLVFRYEGLMVFTVKIFDSNGCLKDYNSRFSRNLMKPGFHILEDGSPRSGTSGTKDGSSSEINIKRKKKFSRVHEVENRAPLGDRSITKPNPPAKKIKSVTKSKPPVKKNKLNISSSPLTHEAVIKEYHIRHAMPLPKIFGSSSEKSLERGIIIVKNEKEETWPVMFNYCGYYNHLCGGWTKFCAENKIQVGDECKFVIVEKNEIQVIVSKSTPSQQVLLL